jgi:hypothetical protein
MTKRHRILIASASMLAGCSQFEQAPSARVRTEGWTSLRLPGATKAQALDAGVHAMRQWFRLEPVSAADNEVRSVTMEFDQKGGTERIRDAALKYKNRMRRWATLVVQEQGPDVIVRCAVQVQRLDTSDHRVFHDNQRFVDYPNETPIDREAGVTASQDQVWTDMPRDRQLETDILSVVKSQLSAQGVVTTGKAS